MYRRPPAGVFEFDSVATTSSVTYTVRWMAHGRRWRIRARHAVPPLRKLQGRKVKGAGETPAVRTATAAAELAARLAAAQAEHRVAAARLARALLAAAVLGAG